MKGFCVTGLDAGQQKGSDEDQTERARQGRLKQWQPKLYSSHLCVCSLSVEAEVELTEGVNLPLCPFANDGPCLMLTLLPQSTLNLSVSLFPHVLPLSSGNCIPCFIPWITPDILAISLRYLLQKWALSPCPHLGLSSWQLC